MRIVTELQKKNGLVNQATARHWLLLAVGLFLAGTFLNISYDVLLDRDDKAEIQRWDEKILVFVANHRQPAVTASMVDLTSLGSATIVALVTAVFFWGFLFLKDYWGIAQLALASIGAASWTWLFKHFAERPRPSIVAKLIDAEGFSFPSGHSVSAAALYVTFATIAGRHFASWRHRLALQILAAGVIGCVAFSRVYLGVHYPSDVFSGALFGASWAYLVAGTLGFVGGRLRKASSEELGNKR